MDYGDALLLCLVSSFVSSLFTHIHVLLFQTFIFPKKTECKTGANKSGTPCLICQQTQPKADGIACGHITTMLYQNTLTNKLFDTFYNENICVWTCRGMILTTSLSPSIHFTPSLPLTVPTCISLDHFQMYHNTLWCVHVLEWEKEGYQSPEGPAIEQGYIAFILLYNKLDW